MTYQVSESGTHPRQREQLGQTAIYKKRTIISLTVLDYPVRGQTGIVTKTEAKRGHRDTLRNYRVEMVKLGEKKKGNPYTDFAYYNQP